jgi:hypothetical protein
MTLPTRFSLLHSDLNDFLFAAVGDEANGMPLNVVSALTRLGVDPWDEAARLSALPKAVAVETLASMIARLPICRPPRSGQLGDQPQIGEAVAAAWAGGAGESRSRSHGGQTAASPLDGSCLSDTRGGGACRHLVTELGLFPQQRGSLDDRR